MWYTLRDSTSTGSVCRLFLGVYVDDISYLGTNPENINIIFLGFIKTYHQSFQSLSISTLILRVRVRDEDWPFVYLNQATLIKSCQNFKFTHFLWPYIQIYLIFYGLTSPITDSFIKARQDIIYANYIIFIHKVSSRDIICSQFIITLHYCGQSSSFSTISSPQISEQY